MNEQGDGLNGEDAPAPIPPSTQTEPGIHVLTVQLYNAKREESLAKAKRIEAEKAIAKLVPTEGDQGSKTVDAGDGMRVTVKRGLNYKADVKAIRGLDLGDVDIPLTLVPSHYDFDKKAYERIRADNPGAAAKLAECVVATPAKVAVTVKLV